MYLLKKQILITVARLHRWIRLVENNVNWMGAMFHLTFGGAMITLQEAKPIHSLSHWLLLRYFFLLHLIIFKAQEYLCLEIFGKPMIQVHGKTILSMEFKSITKAHDSNPQQFSLAISKPNSHLQHQSPILIGNIRAQFLLATSKLNFH